MPQRESYFESNAYTTEQSNYPTGFQSSEFRLSVPYAILCRQLKPREYIAMKAGTIAQILLLQKPNRKRKSKEHVTHLQRRPNLWHKGDIQSLLEEGRCIQKHLHTSPRPSDDQVLARTFCRLMMQGEVQKALRHLSRKTSGGVLSLEDLVPVSNGNGNGNQTHMRTTHDVLLDKHTPGASPVESSLLHDAPEPVNPIVFDNLNADAIHQAALHTNGAAGLSGLDAYARRRLCSSFESASRNLYMLRLGRSGSPHMHYPYPSRGVECIRGMPTDPTRQN